MTEDRISELEDRLIEFTQIFLNHISDKGIISKIKKELSKFNSKETINLIRN